MRRSTIVDVTARLIFHSALVLSLFLLLAGHDQAGGGFVGGLVVGTALAVHHVAGGIGDVRAVSRLAPWTIAAAGLVLAVGAALTPLVAGGSVLEHGALTVDIWFFGAVKASSTLAFDTGVFAIVVGLVLTIFEAFHDEAEPEAKSS